MSIYNWIELVAIVISMGLFVLSMKFDKPKLRTLAWIILAIFGTTLPIVLMFF